MFTKSWLSWFWQSGLVGLLTSMGVGESAFRETMSKTLAQFNQAPSVGTVVTVNDNIFEITGGTIVGGRNLFHSFPDFSVPADRIAHFLNDTSIVNILTRVTGGNPSDIQGTIRANGTANLFLMNPNGILFGPNARLEIGGSFVATTASAIRFPGDSEFSLDSTVDSQNPLLSINPSALLFNQVQKAAIENRSTAISGSDLVGTNVLGLRVPDNRSLLLVGGDVNLNGGTLNALGGRIEMGGLAADGSVGLNVDGNNLRLSFPDSVARGNVTLTNAAEANVIADNGGSLAIYAQNLELSGNSFLRAGIRRDSGTVDSRAGDITLDVPGSVTIRDSVIFNILQSRAEGKGGNINIKSGSLSLTDGAQIIAATFGQGDVGSVSVQTDEAVSLAGRNTTIFSSVQAGGVGNGGNINITAGSLSLNNSAQLQTSVNEASGSLAAGRGDAGDVNINVRDAMTMDGASGRLPSAVFTSVERGVVGNAGNINIIAGSLSLINGAQLATIVRGASDTLAGGRGNAGNVSVDVRNTLTIAGVDSDGSRSGIFSLVQTGAVGDSGDISLQTGSMSLSDDGLLSASMLGQGKAGNISIQATDIVSLRNAFIFSDLGQGAEGQGGDIRINARSLSLTDSAQITAATFGKGDAGSIFVQTDEAVSLAGRNTSIFSNVRAGGIGNGGDINITAGSLSLTNGAQLLTSVDEASGFLTAGRGDAGDVNINVRDAVKMDGASGTFPSGVRTNIDRGVVGNGGDISITAGSLSLTNDAQLVTSTSGKGKAGTIALTTQGAISFDGTTGGTIGTLVASTVDAGAVGDGGDIKIAAESLSLTNGAQLATSVRGASDTLAGGRGNAGNVSVDVRNTLTIAGVDSDGSRSGIFSLVQTGAVGDSGDISLQTGSMSLSDGGLFNASMLGQGKAGNISIQATDIVSLRNAFIFSDLGQGAEGQGGDIRINARSLSLTDRTQIIAATSGKGDAGSVFVQTNEAVSLAGRNTTIFSNVQAGGVGNGGNINITAGSLSLTNGAQLVTSVDEASGSLAAGRGDAGDVNINVRDAVTMDGASGTFPSGVGTSVDRGVVGNGGKINITAGSLSLTNDAQLRANTSGQGKAGTIALTVKGAISFDGTAGGGLGTGVRSTVDAGAIGDGGDIKITANSLSLTVAQLAAATFGFGDAGSVFVQTDEAVSLVGRNTTIFSNVQAGGVGNGGDINITAGSLSLTNGAQLLSGVNEASGSLAAGRGDAGDVNINIRDAVTIDGASDTFPGKVSTDVGRGVVGNGGNINITAGSLSLTNGAQLATSTFGQGKAGTIMLTAKRAIFFDGTAGDGLGSGALSTVEAGAVGNGGDINVAAESLSLTNGAQLISSVRGASGTLLGGRGNAGNVSVDVRNTFTVAGSSRDGLSSGIFSSVGTGAVGNGSNISIQTDSVSLFDGGQLNANMFGQGKAGNISIQATNTVSLRNAFVFSNLGQGAEGQGGDIRLSARLVSLTDGAQVAAATFGKGDAGSVFVQTDEAVSLAGRNTTIFSSVEAGAVGNGSDIKITADSLSLTNGAQLVTSVRGASGTLPGGRGNAGNVSVDVRNTFTVAGSSRDGLSSGMFSRVGTGAVGNGGNISLQTGSLSLFDGGQINANMFGQGKAGNISIRATDAVFLRNAFVFSNLGEGAEGQGGDIRLNARSLSLTDGTQLIASSRGRGNAGNIFINVRETLQSKDSTISTAATQFAGGAIDIVAKNIRLRGNSDIRTNVSSGAGGGGNITLTANSIIAFDDSDILAFARDGKGGDVIFNTLAFFGSDYKPAPKGTDPETLDNNNRVDINASGATPGIISIPDTSSIQNSLTELQENSIDTNALIADSCIARSQKDGTFFITGSGGLPHRPGVVSMSLYPTGSVRNVPNDTLPSNNSSTRQWQNGDPIVEPQGVYQLPNGKLVLSRECAQ